MSATATTGVDVGTIEPTAAHDRLQERAEDRDEPTETKTLRARYGQRLRGRWDAIRAAMREGIVENDALGLQTEALVDAPRDFAFETESGRVQAFDRWLQRQVDREILEAYGADNEFVRQAYERGVQDANVELRALGIADGGTGAEVTSTGLQLPVHRDQLEALYTRNFNALQGMSDATANQTRRVLSEGLASGESPRTIARDLADRIEKVGKHRANLIGRTEVLHSHNRARATEWQRAGVGQVDILIAADACPECQALKAGAPYPVDEAGGLLPLHPQCRCALTIHTSS